MNFFWPTVPRTKYWPVTDRLLPLLIIFALFLQKPTTTTIPASSVPSLSTSYATGDPTASALTPQHGLNETSLSGTSSKNNNNATTVDPFLLEKQYEKQFLMLRICVLGTIGSVLSSLALMFWIYFMYLWRTWDSGKSRAGDSSQYSGGGLGGSQAVLLCEDGTTLSKRKSLGSMASDGTADDNDHDVDDGLLILVEERGRLMMMRLSVQIILNYEVINDNGSYQKAGEILHKFRYVI